MIPDEAMRAPPIKPGWFAVNGAAIYTGFSVSAIESALRLGQLESRVITISGARRSRRIRREWLDAWIEGTEIIPGDATTPPEKPDAAAIAAQIAFHAAEIQRLSILI